ncbi:MAG: methionine synthase [Dehalococcoidales bacterium]|nr:methionine synthase [Dehalococcoidales bacterium]
MIEFGCLPTIIGSMPHTDPAEACALVSHHLKDIPAWPQLPKRSFKENMYAQFSQGFPGAVLKDDSLYVDRSQDLDKPLEKLYAAYLDNDVDKYPISPDYAAGLHSFLGLTNLSPLAVKGQVTGPVTWGLTVADNEGKAIIYDDVLADAMAKFLRLKAGWQEKELSQISKNTIIFVDEPYMASFGSVSVPLSKEKVVSLLDEVLGGIGGLKGVHCCGNTDWSVLLSTKIDILSFDAYNYAQSLSLYPSEVKSFLDRKGNIAWGIVPNDELLLAKETAASLKDRLEEAMAPFTRKGVPFKQLIEQGLLTPSCGLAPLNTTDAAGRALELLAELSAKIRKRYI